MLPLTQTACEIKNILDQHDLKIWGKTDGNLNEAELIIKWLGDNNANIKVYAILVDDAINIRKQYVNKFVKTSFYIGLTDEIPLGISFIGVKKSQLKSAVDAFVVLFILDIYFQHDWIDSEKRRTNEEQFVVEKHSEAEWSSILYKLWIKEFYDRGKGHLPELMPWSESYRSYERIQKQSLADRTAPPGNEKPRTPRKRDSVTRTA